MSVAMQIILGSFLLFICIAIHIYAMLNAITYLRYLRHRLQDMRRIRLWATVLGIALLAIVGANTIEVWLFAISLLTLGGLQDFGDAIYFALVTYTTLGYGDVVLAKGYRIYGAFGAVTGLLAFGFSTAFLLSLFNRLVPADED